MYLTTVNINTRTTQYHNTCSNMDTSLSLSISSLVGSNWILSPLVSIDLLSKVGAPPPPLDPIGISVLDSTETSLVVPILPGYTNIDSGLVEIRSR